MRAKKYKHIFFDLDQTLWDFEKCSAETLRELFLSHELEKDCNFSMEELVDKFYGINNKLWAEFSSGKISKKQLRDLRFKLVFNELKYDREDLIEIFAEEYLDNCPKKPYLIPYAVDVLEYLGRKYELHIITNGFEEVQQLKMESSGIIKYFKEIITSEKAGHRKPEKEIFKYAIKQTGGTAADSIMIGDSLEADILGASNSLIDHVFYNPRRIKYTMKVTYEIDCLSSLKKLL